MAAEHLAVRVEIEARQIEIGERVAVADVEEEVSRALVVAILEHLDQREAKQAVVELDGALDLIGHRTRTAAAPLSQPAEEIHRLPLLGQIAAGSPLLAEENVEERIAVPEPLGRSADFLLTVRGDSMIEAGILDGDTLVVRKQEDASNGDVVVALVGDDEGANEATVKTFYR